MPIIYFIGEFLFQHYPDEDHWKLSRPPPLDYPDVEVVITQTLPRIPTIRRPTMLTILLLVVASWTWGS
jgi:hypothetical protein